MTVRTFMIAAAACTAAVSLPVSANAAQVIQLTPDTSMFVGIFNGTINDTTTFSSLAAGSSLFLSLSGSGTAAFSTLAATFNGAAIPLTISGNTFSGLFTPTAGNVNTLLLTGANAGLGAFTGTLTVLSAAVPEISTWAMMTLGFGALGYSLRRRRTSFSLA